MGLTHPLLLAMLAYIQVEHKSLGHAATLARYRVCELDGSCKYYSIWNLEGVLLHSKSIAHQVLRGQFSLR